MKRTKIWLSLALLFSSMMAPAWVGELVWTRSTGQHRVEADPVVTDVDGDGAMEILAVNKFGQVTVWRQDGSAFGSGQDGTVVQLVAQVPEERWTSTPRITTTQDNQRRYIFVSALKGSVVALAHSLCTNPIRSRSIYIDSGKIARVRRLDRVFGRGKQP